MKKLYSIGETAKLMGISVQTLRHYSNMNLLSPAYINEETGYRYYTFDQFHIIDRIHYLRSLDLSLAEIREIMADKKVDKITSYLELQKRRVEEQIEELKNRKEDIQWYLDYFTYMDSGNFSSTPHVQHLSSRQVLYTDARNLSVEIMEVNLSRLRNSFTNESIHYRRQFGYLLNYDALLNRQWQPEKYFIYLTEISEVLFEQISPHVLTLPEGDYLCCSIRLRHLDELKTGLIAEYFKDRESPAYVIANEHEDNLSSYQYCPYELQFPL